MKKLIIIAVILFAGCNKEGSFRTKPTPKVHYIFQVEEVSKDGGRTFSNQFEISQ